MVNGGETLHLGLETGISLNLHEIFNSDYLISLSANSTFIRSEYSADRYININNERINIKYNKLPYAPEFTFTGLFDVTAPFGLGLHFAATYVSSQFTDELNTIVPTPSGETGSGRRNEDPTGNGPAKTAPSAHAQAFPRPSAWVWPPS